MDTRLFINKEVSDIVGLSPRQVLSWTEKGLVEPERPAKKAGERRGYNYYNLLEFGLAKYLLDIACLQFHTASVILRELKEDGAIKEIKRDGQCGVLFYVFTNEKSETDNIRIISSKDLKNTFKEFKNREFEEINSSRVTITVNLSEIKKEIDNGLEKYTEKKR